MAQVWASQIFARLLIREEGVKEMFGITGGHTMPFEDWFCFEGGKIYHMRHEQGAAYAADAYARSARRVGVCYGTAGPGMYNMTPGIAQAYWCKSPVVAFLGQHPVVSDERSGLQEGYAEKVYASITKWTRRVVDPYNMAFFIKKAFMDAIAYPPRPVAIEFPLDKLNWEPIDSALPQWGFTPNWYDGKNPASGGDPEEVAKVADFILSSEKPLIVAGEGVWWAEAGPELRELAEYAKIPVNTRRIARGAVPEDHPLHVGSGYRGRFLRGADLIIVIGLRLGYLERFAFMNPEAKVVQINESLSEIIPHTKTHALVIGNPKIVLKQILDMLKASGKEISERKEWIAMIEQGRADHKAKVTNLVDEVKDNVPTHPQVLGKVIADFVNEVIPEATIIYDSYTGTNYLTDKLSPKFYGLILDSGEQAGVGHEFPMAIGAQVARPGKPVLSYVGDGGIGVGGMDMETAARYKLPVVYVMYNDGKWIAGLEKFCYGKGWRALGPQNPHGRDNDTGVRYRYDKMAEIFGCHTEYVTKPSEIRPALERAFNSGKTAFVNIETDPDVYVSMFTKAIDWGPMWWHIPPDLWEKEGWGYLSEVYKQLHGGQEYPTTERDWEWGK